MKKEANIIYPFYQYGEYEKFDPSTAKYYIPGSSIKGALGCEHIYTDDVSIKQCNLSLKIISKLQYTKADFKPFFKNVAVEMLKSGVEFDVTICATGKDVIEKLIKNRNYLTKKQLAKAAEIMEELLAKKRAAIGENAKDWQESVDQLVSFQKVLESFREETTPEREGLLFLGGYKGEIFSRKEVDLIKVDDYKGTFYRDEQNGYPFGLVEIVSINEMI